MSGSQFFEEPSEQSIVKTTIVKKYFLAWATVVMRWAKRGSNKIAYLDLFSGPGYFKDGTKSTPILVLESALVNTDLRNMLVSVFNDMNMDHCESLRQAIKSIPNIETLRYQPLVLNECVGQKIADELNHIQLIPSLSFVDPWGYKGLSLQLIKSLTNSWGCDCIIFFNYNRINMGLNNKKVKDYMDDLFGEKKADALRQELPMMSPAERELHIIKAFEQAIHQLGREYVLPFAFSNRRGSKTSHLLVFITKHIKGFTIMKDIMAKLSSSFGQGVPSFEFNPVTKAQSVLFDYSQSLDVLTSSLLLDFAGQRISMIEIYNQHNIGKRYIKPNYKEALLMLEEEGKIAVQPSANKRRRQHGRLTFGDNTVVIFPPSSEG